MKITNFEDTGLDRINNWIDINRINEVDERSIKETLKTINISFVIEGIDRIQSTLLCELKDSYVQQSQRYVTMGEDAYILPELSKEDTEKSKELLNRVFDLYIRMSELKEGDFKGRPKIGNYKYGVPVEDARYILPLATKTNLAVAMTADKLFDLFYLINDKKYYSIFNEFRKEIRGKLPVNLIKLLPESYNSDNNKELIEKFYSEDLKKIDNENKMVLLSKFEDLDVKVGLGALTSTQSSTPSQILTKWGDEARKNASGVVKRVLGYGHDSISEQARTTFGMMCSMVTYHQQIRHRLSKNHREDFSNLIKDRGRKILIPPTIRTSKFEEEFLSLANETKDFRMYILNKYGQDKALPFILNCDQVKLVISSNARMDIAMLSERVCENAQWEIRELSTEKLMILKSLSEILYNKAHPSCVFGKCKEGKLSCGKQEEVRKKFI
ncbi:FAD-dependent thymidylate synthase [Dethiothermospora halolimnae]|uniref:FAD-dependent thymidylate synthase n=1 Tax=Dethiothermospora halolimnae TaxID=3114390 RepID=UPI003CCBA062